MLYTIHVDILLTNVTLLQQLPVRNGERLQENKKMTIKDIETVFEEIDEPFIDMREIAREIPHEDRLLEFINWYEKSHN